MIRSAVVLAAVCLLGLFGYFYMNDSSGRTNKQKAKDAVVHVGDTVRDQGVASLVSVRLTSKFGLEATRFLHTYYDDGHVLVYGLLPQTVSADAVRDEAGKVVGVKQVDVVVSPPPAFVNGTPAEAGAPAGAKGG